MKKIFLVIVVFLICSSVFAFDGNRKGFLLGFGLGMSKMNVDFGSGGEEDHNSVTSDFKLGWAFTDDLLIYYNNKASWFDAYIYYNNKVEEKQLGLSLRGIGASYYLSEYGLENTFISVELGQGILALAEDGKQITNYSGNGYYLGLGYEFAKHYYIELGYRYISLDNDMNSSNGLDSSAVSVTINALAY